jgi:hypothetical protein
VVDMMDGAAVEAAVGEKDVTMDIDRLSPWL